MYVDGTLGRAGHSLEIAKRLTTGRLIGIDRDETAITAAKERLADYLDRVTLVHSNFDRVGEILDELGLDGADGMLFDLGVSSPQLDEGRAWLFLYAGRAAGYADGSQRIADGPDVVNGWSYEELRRILYEYGEERYAPVIAKHICRAREQAPIERTGELVEIIKSAMPPQALREKQHPAKRSFQALRIAVNGELDALPPMLEAAVSHLHTGGRLAVISFHSLEDRIIKKTMQDMATGCLPAQLSRMRVRQKPRIRLVSRKPIVADEAELERNPRSRSAKLRVAEKV